MTSADVRDTYLAGENPFEDPLQRFGTIYARAQHIGGLIANPLRFPSWPNPVDEMVDFDELACMDGWVGFIAFAGASYARFAWATFVPNPSEIFRKFLLGNYRCGGRFLPKTKSPLNFVIGGRGTKMLAMAAKPFTTALWWWWVGASAYEAFQVTQTVLNREEVCIASGETCTLGDGVCFLPMDGGDFLEAPISYAIEIDPNNMYPGTGSTIALGKSEYSAAAAVRIDDPHGQLAFADVELITPSLVEDRDGINTIQENSHAGGVAHVRRKNSNASQVSLQIRGQGNVGPAGSIRCEVVNFTVTRFG